MKKIIFFVVIVLLMTITVFLSLYLPAVNARDKAIAPKNTNKVTNPPPSEISKENENVVVNNSPAVENTKGDAKNSAPKNENKAINNSTFSEPISGWRRKITLNPFGNQPSKKKIDESKYTDLVCKGGKYYPGYHTAVDIEVSPEERNKPVPVFSIADGTVRQIGTVSGYGGLAVIEYNINGQYYTAYYGHIDLSKATVKTGSPVKKGQKIGELAPACSSANGNTRKHLHFGIHKGKSIVVLGYVNTKKELANWIDPREVIK